MRRRAHVLAPARAAGFTLVELVVALSMVTVMMVLLFGGLRLGARVWDTVEQRTGTLHERQMIARFIMRELEQARPLTFAPRDGDKRLAFVGKADAARCTSWRRCPRRPAAAGCTGSGSRSSAPRTRGAWC